MNHGTPGSYRRGCRCEVCRASHAARQRDYQHRKRQAALGIEVPIAPAVDEAALSDLLNELFPLGLTDDCPARRALSGSGGTIDR